MIGVLVAVGVHGVAEAVRRRGREPAGESGQPDRGDAARLAARVGLVVGLAATAGPLLVLASARPPLLRAAGEPCPSGTIARFVRVPSGSYLRIESTGDAGQTARRSAVEVHEAALAQTIVAVELKNDAARFAAGSTLINTYDLAGGRPVWLLAPSGMLATIPATYRVCARASSNELSRTYGLQFAESATVVRER
jgi:hypothetical protein